MHLTIIGYVAKAVVCCLGIIQDDRGWAPAHKQASQMYGLDIFPPLFLNISKFSLIS
jgi:hypothetical protein